MLDRHLLVVLQLEVRSLRASPWEDPRSACQYLVEYNLHQHPPIRKITNKTPTSKGIITSKNSFDCIYSFIVRKSSLVPRQSSLTNNVRTKDPRPLGEKQFFSDNIKILTSYLTANGFNHPIGHSTLSRPSQSDFNNIMRFLFKQLDPKYECKDKMEDEVVNMFKFLGYPINISKSSIAAVGSPHAWPGLLAAITWLIELLNYNKECISQENQLIGDVDVTDQTSSEKSFHNYISKAYHFFITGNDEQQMSVHQQFLSAYEHKNLIIRDKIDSLDKRNLALANEIEDLKHRTASLPDVDQRRKDLQRTHANLTSAFEEKKKVAQQLKMTLEEKSRELEKGKQLIVAINQDLLKLKDTIARQEISPEDIANMINERERLEEAQKIASDHRQSLQRKIWELEMNLRDKVQGLEDTVKAYHSIAEDLKMIPQDARNARGENLMIEIDIRAKRKEGLLKTQVKAHVIPVLQEVRKELNEMTLELRSELIAEQDKMEELESKKQDMIQACESYDAKSKRADASYKREKESLDQSNDIHLREIDNMESRLLQLTDTAAEEARITSATRRIAEASALRNARNQEYNRTKKHLLEAIMEVVGLCANHRELLQRQLELCKSAYLERIIEIQRSKDDDKLSSYAKVVISLLTCSLSLTFLCFVGTARSRLPQSDQR